jgi:tetratricopeptide (TPR) repeat protein
MVAGRPAAALRWARTGIEKGKGRVRPDFLGALYCQSMRCALNLGKPKLAVKIGLEGASAYAFTELSYLLGASYVVLRDWANAEKYYELAMILRQRFSEYQMEVGTGSWKALIGLSVVAWERGDRDLAFDRAKRAYEWAPDQGLPNMVYGQVLMARQRWAEAELYLRRAIEIAPALSEAHLRLSQTLVALNRHQEAYDHLNDLWRARPEVPAHAIWLGELLYEVEEYQECVNVLGAAIEQHTDQPAIYQRLAEALVKIGRHEDALNAYSLASALDPKNEQAQMGLSLATYLARWDTLRSSAVRTLSVA